MDAAHPRSRGENTAATNCAIAGSGSSPLTRGKHVAEHLRSPRRGLIPAHAGKTARVGEYCRDLAAHPRSRGENTPEEREYFAASGSSPLTRGKLDDHVRRWEEARLIPAHAGKTSGITVCQCLFPAHPRSRGENDKRYIPLIHERGSSPLTRGKPRLSWIDLTRGRLIPAHAGKTTGAT